MGNQTSQNFHVGGDVRQGDILLTTLFNLTLHRAIENIHTRGMQAMLLL